MPNPIINRRVAIAASKAAAMPAVVTDWANRVMINGGAMPSALTLSAATTLYNSLQGAGVWSSINILNFLAPDSLIACRTPFKVGGGVDPWGINDTFGGLDANGLNAFNPGHHPWLNIFDGSTSLLSNCIASPNSAHVAVYAYISNANACFDFGQQDGASNGFILNSEFSGSGSQAYIANTAQPATFGPAPKGNGFFMGSRTTSLRLDLYFASSVTAWSSIANNTVANAHSFSTLHTLPLFDLNNNGALFGGNNNTLSFFCMGDGLSSAQGQAVYNAAQAFRVAIGGGFR